MKRSELLVAITAGAVGSLLVSFLKDRIPKTIDIKYFKNNPEFVLEITDKGDWIDLKTTKTIVLKKGERTDIPLGVAMRLPSGYEAHLLPRSSTCRKCNIVMENSQGIIDNSFNGDRDQWAFRAYALEDTTIPNGTRIAQFRIVKNQPKIKFNTVKTLSFNSRGGFGSTGA